jgi:hypothetical protein
VRARPPAKALGGCLCLAATLLLASPGVRVVRAADGAAATVPPGPVCSEEAPGAEAADGVRPAPRRGHRTAPSDRVVVLNVRGYNYDAGVRAQGPDRRVPAAPDPR